MLTRTSSKTVTFGRHFSLKGVDRILPAGDYRVVTDEELIEGLSFPVYRRVSTMIFLPAESHKASSIEMVTIDPLDLQTAQERDAATHQGSKTDAALRSTFGLSGKYAHEGGAGGSLPDRGHADMRGWFVPPIVIPVGLLLLVAAIAVYHM